MKFPKLTEKSPPTPRRERICARQHAGVTCELRFAGDDPNAAAPRPLVPRSFAPHFHNEYQLIVAQHTVVEYRYRGATCLAPPRSLMIFAPGEVHAARGLRDDEYQAPLRTLFLAPQLVEEEGEVAAGEIASRLETQGSGYDIGFGLHDCLSLPASTLQREETLQQMVVHLRGAARRGAARHGAVGRNPERAKVRRAREFLQDHWAGEVSLQTLARHAGLSPFHLCRVFGAEVGVAPHEFQLQLRIEHARPLILRGTGLLEVALECGFADQSHFCREFKKRIGVSPGRYLALG